MNVECPRPRPGAVRRSGRPPARFLTLSLALLALAVVPAAALADRGEIGPPDARVLWRTIPHVPCAGDSIRLRFSLCECSWDLKSAAFEPILTLRFVGEPGRHCVTCTPDSVDVAVPGPLSAGNHSYSVRMLFDPPSDTVSVHHDVIQFAVGFDCPPRGVLPYLDSVVIGEGPPCPTCPARVCPGDSVDVVLSGSFPDACRHLVGVSLHPNPTASPLPHPPVVRLTYGSIAPCALCPPGPVPWQATVRLPGQPYLGGLEQRLPIEAVELALCTPDSIPGLLGRIGVPFVVAERCSTPPGGDPCFNVAWSDDEPGRCNATFGKLEAPRLVFRVGSTVAIAGLEGTLDLDSDALGIGDVFAARPGWVVQFSSHLDGSVRFIAFATSPEAAIPGTRDGHPQDVIGVRVQPAVRFGGADVVRLTARGLLVSDRAGQAIHACPFFTDIDPPPWVALLCRAGRCDANGDGHADVRDLVVMVGCLGPQPLRDPPCPDPSLGLDCTADGIFDLEDVFCCARVMLGGERPDTTGGDSLRVAPQIALRFGLPRELGAGEIEVPLDFAGLDGVAAARVDVAYPDTRYEVVDVTFAGMPAGWWTVHDVRDGRVRVALLDLSAIDGVPRIGLAGGTALVRLRLVAGAAAGGELAVADHDFAAGDGIRLSTPNADARLALGPSGRVALSAPRPNPFAAGTTFALTLPVAGPIDVGVFDVAGRRVATLLREAHSAAGVYSLSWNGTDAGGGGMPGGVYFVRVAGASRDGSRKLLFLPSAAR